MIPVLSVILGLLLTGCDLKFGFPVPIQSQTTSTTFIEGFYEATTDANFRHYPLLAIKKSGTEVHLYQVSTVDQPSFGFGSRNPALSSTVLATLVLEIGASDFVGSVRVDGKFLRLRSRKFNPADKSSVNFPEVGEILANQDYLLEPVTLNKFLTDFRTIMIKFVGSTSFSQADETNCKTLYNFTCKQAYQDPL